MPHRTGSVETTKALLELVHADRHLDLADHDPGETFGWDKEAAKAALVPSWNGWPSLQTLLFAEGTRSLLVVLQAMDAGGKDGVAPRRVHRAQPGRRRVTSFGVPTEEELAHDFLWRVHQHTPADGQIGVFNRSHYEDVLVVRVKELAPPAVWRKRYAPHPQLRAAARRRGHDDRQVVPPHLHRGAAGAAAGPHRQPRRALEVPPRRPRRPQAVAGVHEGVPRRPRPTSTPAAPWYVIPGDRKWVRNLAVAKILRHTLEQLDPQYPEPEEGIEGLVVVDV